MSGPNIPGNATSHPIAAPVEGQQILQEGHQLSMASYLNMLQKANLVALDLMKQTNGDPKVIAECERFQKEMCDTQQKAITKLWQDCLGLSQAMLDQLCQGVQRVHEINHQQDLIKKRIEKQTSKEGCLDLQGLGFVTDDFLEKITMRSADLTTANLKGTQVTIKGIQALLLKSPNLINLEIDESAHWPDQKTIDFSCCPNIAEDSILSVLNCCPSLETIDMWKCVKPTDKLLLFICESFDKTVMTLNLYGCSNMTMAGFKKIGNLTKLFELSTPPLGLDGIKYILKCCGARLKEFNPNPNNQEISTAIALSSDDFDKDGISLSEDSIINLIKAFKSLTYFNFRRSNFSDKCCASLNATLVALGIQGCKKISDQSLSIIAKRCPDLAFLAIDICPEITDAGLAHLVNLEKLTKLHLSWTKITYAGLLAFLQKCPKIQQLNIGNIPLIKEDNISELKKIYPNIEFIV